MTFFMVSVSFLMAYTVCVEWYVISWLYWPISHTRPLYPSLMSIWHCMHPAVIRPSAQCWAGVVFMNLIYICIYIYAHMCISVSAVQHVPAQNSTLQKQYDPMRIQTLWPSLRLKESDWTAIHASLQMQQNSHLNKIQQWNSSVLH